MDGDNGAIQARLLAISNWPSDISSLRLTPKDVEKSLKKLEDLLVDHPESLSFSSDEYSQLTSFIGCFQTLEAFSCSKLQSMVVLGLVSFTKNCLNNRSFNTETFECFLIMIYATFLAAERRKSIPEESGAKKSAKAGTALEWNHLKATFLEALKSLQHSGILSRAYNTYSDLEQTCSVIVKIVHLLVENAESLKSSQLKSLCIENLALCCCKLGYKTGIRTVIIQDLNYLEHLAEFDAELLSVMANEPFGDTSPLDEIVHNIGSIKFHGDESAAAKITSAFLIKITSLDAKNVLRNVAEIADHLSSEVYSMRMTIIEIFAQLIRYLARQEDRTDQVKAQTKSLLAAIEERLRDVNSFVRSKVLQVLSDLVQANAIPISNRSHLVTLVVGRVMDKSSNVRRRAIQMLGELLRTHPFCIDGGELSLSFFEERIREIDSHLDNSAPMELKDSFSASFENLGSMQLDESKQLQESDSEKPLTDVASLQALLMQKRYYKDAINFVKQLDGVIPILCKLLSSNTKTEVFEVMDFFVDAHIYRLQTSAEGIAKMMHLIWERDLSSEDGTKRSIKEHVLLSYKRIFLEVDSRLSGKERTISVTENLLNLVNRCSVSDLASLEQIIIGFVQKGWIPDAIISALGNVFASKVAVGKPSSENAPSSLFNHRAAIVLLTMVGQIRPDVIRCRVDVLIKIGLGPIGMADPWIVEYSCQALRLLTRSTGAEPDNGKEASRISNDNVVFTCLLHLIMTTPCTARWLQVVNEALKTIYALSQQPSHLAEVLIKQLSSGLISPSDTPSTIIKTSALVKLLFVAGNMAACEVAHLDSVTRHWKASREATDSGSKTPSNNDMEGVTATIEDDINEAVRFIRENELLYGDKSLLTVYGRMVASICSDSSLYPHTLLQNVAAMAMAKFMTVSSKYCDAQLPLFLTILEKSPDPTVRANLSICFADLAQSFPRIVDSNIIYLFRRLSDPGCNVRRNALLVLTHLTLTGMIKVRGQIAEIARCILDEDARVAELARLFFVELAGKDNVIYNHIPDIISNLSPANLKRDEGGEDLSSNDFKLICQFIFDFVKKERQMEGLVEKLCQRFRQCQSARQIRDLAFCLTLINYTSDRTVKRLFESFPLYKDHLIDTKVYACFVEVLNKTKRGAKGETRTVIEDFEKKLLQSAVDQGNSPVEMDEDELLTVSKSTRKSPTKTKAKKQPRSRLTMRRGYAFSDEEGDEDIPAPPASQTKTKMNPLAASLVAVAEEEPDQSMDVDDDELLLTAQAAKIISKTATSKARTSRLPRRSRLTMPSGLVDFDEEDDVF